MSVAVRWPLSRVPNSMCDVRLAEPPSSADHLLFYVRDVRLEEPPSSACRMRPDGRPPALGLNSMCNLRLEEPLSSAGLARVDVKGRARNLLRGHSQGLPGLFLEDFCWEEKA
jgi:hypothetical protein